jgi:hypothetical protein
MKSVNQVSQLTGKSQRKVSKIPDIIRSSTLLMKFPVVGSRESLP